MTDIRKSGIALLVGTVGDIVTMAIHPSGAGTLAPAQLERMALGSAIAHSLAIVSLMILVLGAIGLTRRLADADRLAFCGLVLFLFSGVSILIAAAVSGFIVPGIMRMMVRDVAAAAPDWRIAIASIFQINQAFSRIYSVGVSGAMVLWGAAALRHGGLSRWIAIYGCVAAALVMVGIASGHLTLNVHGMSVVVLAQGIWFVGAGVGMIREEPGGFQGSLDKIPS